MESDAGKGKDLFKTLVWQLVSILNMVMTGVRNLKHVTDVLQIIISDPDFASKLRDEAQPVEKKVSTKFLSFVGTIAVPVLTETWSVLDRFKKDLSDEARVKILIVGTNFTACFGKMVVGANAGSMFSYYTLTKYMHDQDIIAELGGEVNVETTLAEIYWLMVQQKNGETGVLLNNGYENIFYVRGVAGVLFSLSVYWYHYGWRVNAYELDHYLFNNGRRVFSHHS